MDILSLKTFSSLNILHRKSINLSGSMSPLLAISKIALIASADTVGISKKAPISRHDKLASVIFFLDSEIILDFISSGTLFFIISFKTFDVFS